MASHRAHIWEDNMKKTMQCKAAPELEIISGEESILLRFNIVMWANLQDTDKGLEALKEASVSETCALIVWAAGKDNNDDFTLEKARTLVSGMEVSNVSEIINIFSDSVGMDLDKLDNAQKKMILQIMKAAVKN